MLVSDRRLSTSSFAEHAWGNYHWERATNSVSLTLGYNNLNDTWHDHLELAVGDDWDQSGVLSPTIVPGEASPLRQCTPIDGKIEVCADTYGKVQ